MFVGLEKIVVGVLSQAPEHFLIELKCEEQTSACNMSVERSAD